MHPPRRFSWDWRPCVRALFDAHTIGVLDSGLGGLTVVKALLTRLEGIQVLYFADTAGTPWGSRNADDVFDRCARICQLLEQWGVGCIAVACHTASLLAGDRIRSLCRVPVIGVAEPTAHFVINVAHPRCVALLGTIGTIAAETYQKWLADEGIVTLSCPCPALAGCLEDGLAPDDPVVRGYLDEYMSGVASTRADLAVLGCTHYPILAAQIQDALGEQTRLIDAGHAVTHLLGHWRVANNPGAIHCYVTGAPEAFRVASRQILGRDVDSVLRVDGLLPRN